MSYKNPNHNEIINLVPDDHIMKPFYCKNYHNLAVNKFRKKYKKHPTLNDWKEIYNLYVIE